jgi:hypothetical protein
MASAWTYLEAPALRAPLRAAHAALNARAVGASRGTVSQVGQETLELQSFINAFANFSTAISTTSTNYLSNVHLYPPSNITRFYEGRDGPWSCIYWIDDNISVCAALFCFYNTGWRRIERRVLRHSVLIASTFAFMEQQVILWLRGSRGILVP